jgi:hypothetical protein
MTATGTPAAMKARRYLEDITPDLLRLLENAPAFGSAGFDLTFHENEITSIDLRASVKRRLAPKNQREGGAK